MGRHSCRRMRKVRIVKGKPVVSLPWWSSRDLKEHSITVEAAPDEWKLVDEESGLEFKKFDSFKAAKDYCIRRDYDFGQFGRTKNRAKTKQDRSHDNAVKETTL